MVLAIDASGLQSRLFWNVRGGYICNNSVSPLRGAISTAKIETGRGECVQDPTSSLGYMEKIAYAQGLQIPKSTIIL